MVLSRPWAGDAFEVPPTTPLTTDMGKVMELMHRMGTVSLAQIAVRLGCPRLVIALILRALIACGWAISITVGHHEHASRLVP